MGSRLQELINILTLFNPLELEKKENKEAIVNKFRSIIDSLTNNDIKLLGVIYEKWKVGCLYHFLTSPGYRTNLSAHAPKIIQKYFEINFDKTCKPVNYKSNFPINLIVE